MTTPQDVSDNLTFVYQDIEGVIAFELTNKASNDSIERFLVVHNANRRATRITLPTDGGWKLIADNNKFDYYGGIKLFNGGSRIQVPANTSYIMYQDSSIPDGGNNNLLLILLGSLAGLGLAGAGVYFYLKKKKVAVAK
jgi:hypothetical protein